MKTYKIEVRRQSPWNNLDNKVKVVEGSVDKLTEYFQYVLEVGHSYNRKISIKPKTFRSLIKNLNDSYSIAESNLYRRTSITPL